MIDGRKKSNMKGLKSEGFNRRVKEKEQVRNSKTQPCRTRQHWGKFCFLIFVLGPCCLSLLCARYYCFLLWQTVPIFRGRNAQKETIVYHQGIYTFGSSKPGFLIPCLFFRKIMFRMKHMDIYVFWLSCGVSTTPIVLVLDCNPLGSYCK